jgi:hypothetical protein
VEGTPVTVTRVRVPGGDVVQTVYSCAGRGGGGVTVVAIANESPLPVAIAFDRRDLLTERPIGDVPIEGIAGIDLPAGSFVMPVGHRARIRVGVAHEGSGAGALPARLPAPSQVVRGWVALIERASRFVLPSGERGVALAQRVVGERCELVLRGPGGRFDDPAAFVVGCGELVRLGEVAAIDLVEAVAVAVEALGADARWEAGIALAAGARMLTAADEARAARDVARIIARRPASTVPPSIPEGVFAVPWLESQVADGAALFPRGLPAAWVGESIEAHGIPTGARSSVSLAVRWHGARPAVLWEQAGDPLELTAPVTAPGWSTSEPVGEALWPAAG